MPKVTVNENLCKGCGLCAEVCPKGVLALAQEELNAKGYPPMKVVKPGDCTTCRSCAIMCPDCAITVER